MVLADAETVVIDNKEVKSIILQDNGILYKKNEASIIFSFTGTDAPNLYGYNLGYNSIVFWGDGSKEKYVNEGMYFYVDGNTYFYQDAKYFVHSYGDGKEVHTIQIFNVKEIGNSVFMSAQGIDNVFISSDVTEIGYGAFKQCPLTNITLSEGLTSIGYACFSNSNLTEITIPSTVTNLGTNCFGPGMITKICFLWDTAEKIIAYSTDPYQQLSTDYKFYIPEGTTQLYVDKGYPLAKLVEGATSITLTSDKDAIDAGEIATITGTLDYPSQDKIVIFNTKTPESVTMTPGDNYYSIGENGFDITDFTNDFSLYSKPNDEEEYFGIKYSNGGLSVIYTSISGIFPKSQYPVKLHVDKNDIILYHYKNYEDYENQYISCVILSQRGAYNRVKKGLEKGEWKLSATNSLTITKNTGLYSLTDANGQATIEYKGAGAGYVTITGTYVDKNVSDSITITDTKILRLMSEKESIKNNETTVLTAQILPKKESEVICINKIISDENLDLTLTSTKNGSNHMIKAKVTDENDNGVKNINIKLFKEE